MNYFYAQTEFFSEKKSCEMDLAPNAYIVLGTTKSQKN
jgi:hypothetical protein